MYPSTISCPIETESVISKSVTTSDDEDTRISNNWLTDLYLPVKRLPSQKTTPNLGSARTYGSLSVSTGFYSVNTKLDDDGLDYLYFEQENSRPSSPDALHTPEKPFRRHGPCRYIFEEERGFAVCSKRGLINCIALVWITLVIFFAFIVWPVWRKVGGGQLHRDSVAQFDLTRQSGPFPSSDFPTVLVN